MMSVERKELFDLIKHEGLTPASWSDSVTAFTRSSRAKPVDPPPFSPASFIHHQPTSLMKSNFS
jgi:hypothetical protein